jgi:5-methylcytosine-specific restriction protein A
MTPTPRTRGSRWVAIRHAVLQRDGYRCVICRDNGKLVLGDEVDHIVPLECGGTDDMQNLRLLCHACHVDVTNKQRGASVRVATGLDGWPVT